MHTKILYVLVCSDQNYYGEEFIASLYSLRYYNPNAFVTLLTDNDTISYLKRFYPIVLESIDETIEKTFSDDVIPVERSRSLKTRARKFVSGDFLFIDTDTIVTDELSAIDNESAVLGLVSDRHIGNVSVLPSKYKELCERLNLALLLNKPSYKIFNSGVMLVKDVPVVHEFFEEWHKIWLQNNELGIYFDQPPLFCANLKLDLITEINPEWHCQIMGYGIKYIATSKIIHYYTSIKKEAIGGSPYIFANEYFMKKIKLERGINQEMKCLLQRGRNAFSDRVRLLSGAALDFYTSPIARILHNLSLHYPKIYNCINNVLGVFVNWRKN